MRNTLRFLIVFLLLFSLENTFPQQPELVVGDVDLPTLKWGEETANIELTNNSEYIKFIVVMAELNFSGSYLTPSRATRSHYFIEPYGKKEIHPKFHIPGNYGEAELKIVMYDIADTLDAIFPEQIFFEQKFNIRFNMTDDIIGYLQEKISLPPRVEDHPYFDNEFVRLLLILINEGKSVKEIADMTKADESFVQQNIQLLIKERYLKEKDSVYSLVFPVISIKEAEESKKIADKLTDSLVSIISLNMQGYWSVLDSLIEAKEVPRDSNDFISGATLLYRPYPVVASLLLWFDLGQKFVTRAAPLLIYDGTDICNAANTQYMYAVQGGDFFNGSHFYALTLGANAYRILFADHIPEIKCSDNFIQSKKSKRKAKWNYTIDDFPEYFIIDTTTARPLLNHLDKNTDALLMDTYTTLRDLAVKYGHKRLSFGQRYWFWNLVATQTLSKLINNKVIQKRGKGHYRFDSLNRAKK